VLTNLIAHVDDPIAIEQGLDVLPPGAVHDKKWADWVAAGRLKPDLPADIPGP
jgi:hypothetical protein